MYTGVLELWLSEPMFDIPCPLRPWLMLGFDPNIPWLVGGIHAVDEGCAALDPI